MFFMDRSFMPRKILMLLISCVYFFLTKQKSYSHDCLRAFENKKKKNKKKKKNTKCGVKKIDGAKCS